jgi:hypothetical protein
MVVEMVLLLQVLVDQAVAKAVQVAAVVVVHN